MSIGQNPFGILPQSLLVHEKRASVLANNLANQDTPGFKAKDIDFRQALSKIKAGEDASSMLKVTNRQHLTGGDKIAGTDTKFRVPNQPSVDGNTVDGQIEQAEYSENAMRYLASLQFLSGRINGLMLAIKGQR